MAKNKNGNYVAKVKGTKKFSKVSSLIRKESVYSTTSSSKYVSTPDWNKGEYGYYKYIPKTKENMEALIKIKGKPEVYDDKRYGKRFIWM